MRGGYRQRIHRVRSAIRRGELCSKVAQMAPVLAR